MTFLARHKVPLLLFLIGIALFANTLDAQLLFSWDDQHYLTENALIQHFEVGKIFTQAYWGSYIPITLMSYAIEHLFWGLHPAGYHAVNMLIHALNGVLVFFFLLLLTERRMAAIIGAVLFIIHPVQVESVAWISQRKNLLSMFFFLWAFISHIRSRQCNNNRWLWAAWVFYFLSVLSKPAVVGAPILFMAYDYFWARISLRRTILSAVVPISIALFGTIAILVTSAEVGGIKEFWGGNQWSAIQLTFLTTWENVIGLIYPLKHSPHYFYLEGAINHNWRVWAGLFILIGFSGLGFYSVWRFVRDKNHKPVTFFLYLWVLAFMLPVSNIIPIAIQRSDRHIYFPSVMLFLMVGLLCNWLWLHFQKEKTRYVLVAGIATLSLLLMSVTFRLNQAWTDSGTLWRYHLNNFPYDDIAINNLAMYYYRTKQFPMAIQAYNDLAIVTPQNWRPPLFKGLIAMEEERYDDAIRLFRQALPLADSKLSGDIKTQILSAYANATKKAQAEGRTQDLIDYYQEVIEMIPNNRGVFFDLGNAYRAMGNADSAKAAYKQAMAVSPGYYAAAHAAIGQVLLEEGKPEDAQTIFDESMKKEPNAPAASGLCKIQTVKGGTDQSLDACYVALALSKGDAAYADQLVETLLRFYTPEQAIAQAGQKLSEFPDLMYPILGLIHAASGQTESAFESFGHSSSPLSQLKLGQTALAANEYATADEAFSNVLRYNSGSMEAIGGRCLALSGLQAPTEAINYCRMAVKNEPKEVRYLSAYANLLVADNNLNESIENYQHAMDKGTADVASRLAEVYAQLGHLAEAKGFSDDGINLYQKAVVLDPSKKDFQNSLGLALLRQHHFIEAMTSFETAITLDPGFALAYAHKGITAHALGQNEVAKAAFEKSIGIDPHLTVALVGYCVFLKDTGGNADPVCSQVDPQKTF